ncbi:hypothetical protein DFH07DRAFT_731355, partial [Mycena maculata]
MRSQIDSAYLDVSAHSTELGLALLERTPSTSSSISTYPNPQQIRDFAGFPTYAQYKHLEATYLQGISTTARQEKALIPQTVFDRVWKVLSGDDKVEDPAFRHWARVTFSLGVPPVALASPHPHPHVHSQSHSRGAQAQVALLSKGVVVAVREQLYELLCYCHGNRGHRGRDATAKFVKERYSYVPGPLISEFVRACPTCAQSIWRVGKAKFSV